MSHFSLKSAFAGAFTTAVAISIAMSRSVSLEGGEYIQSAKVYEVIDSNGGEKDIVIVMPLHANEQVNKQTLNYLKHGKMIIRKANRSGPFSK